MKIMSGSVVVLATLASGVASAQETFELVSATPAGALGNGTSSYPQVTPDGRYVVFWSNASDLVPGDTNGGVDIFVRDLDTRTTERVSLTSTGAQVDGFSTNGSGGLYSQVTPQISNDGSLVAFSSPAAGIVPGDTNGTFDVFVRDRSAATTTRISVNSDGSQMTGASCAALMSANGRRIVFAHRAAGAPNSSIDWYVHDRASGITQLASIAPDGQPVQIESPHFASGGRYLVFQSVRSVAPYDAGTFVRDLDTGITTAATPGSGWRGDPFGTDPRIEINPLAISTNGRYVLCAADSDLDTNDAVHSSWQWNAWVLDRSAATFRLLTRVVSEPGAEWAPVFGVTFEGLSYVSDDGRIARFSALSFGLLDNTYDDGVTYYEVDAETTQTRVQSLDWRMRPLQPWSNYSFLFAASDDGRTVVMQASGKLGNGFPFPLINFEEQLFVRRVASSAGVTVCAGDGSGAACPCGTSGIPGRGCANAWTDRGSVLETRGNASIADDSLTLIAYDTPLALSVLMQSTSAAPGGGVPFAGGVLCVGSPAVRIGVTPGSSEQLGVVSIYGRGAGDGATIGQLGGISTPGTRYYQVWTRAVGGASCVASRSSLTNGVRVEWRL